MRQVLEMFGTTALISRPASINSVLTLVSPILQPMGRGSNLPGTTGHTSQPRRNSVAETAQLLIVHQPGRLVLLARERDRDFAEERRAIEQSGLAIVTDFADLNPDDQVLMRYFPFAQLVESEISTLGAHPLGSGQAQFLSDIRQWYPVLQSLTPETYFSEAEVVADPRATGPFFCKGLDKSLKQDFFEFCYARDRNDLPRVVNNLRQALPGNDDICIRQYISLKAYGTDPQTQMPLAHEFRCFIFQGQVISQGFYWQSLADPDLALEPPPTELLERIIAAVGDRASYYTADVALTASGEWILIEVNDGGQAGLMGIDSTAHYQRMAAVWAEQQAHVAE